MKTIFIYFFLSTVALQAQTRDSLYSEMIYTLTKDGWTTIRKDTSFSGTTSDVCNGIGKRSEINRLANVHTVITAGGDTIYVVFPQLFKGIVVMKGQMTKYNVEPWDNNYLISNHCPLDKRRLIVLIKAKS